MLRNSAVESWRHEARPSLCWQQIMGVLFKASEMFRGLHQPASALNGRPTELCSMHPPTLVVSAATTNQAASAMVVAVVVTWTWWQSMTCLLGILGRVVLVLCLGSGMVLFFVLICDARKKACSLFQRIGARQGTLPSARMPRRSRSWVAFSSESPCRSCWPA